MQSGPLASRSPLGSELQRLPACFATERFKEPGVSSRLIQEGTFCARTTARVNALRERWWPQLALHVREAIAALRAAPRSACFAALHHVGHRYASRGGPPHSFPLPSRVLNANTLSQRAAAYQRGLPEFQRLNRDWQPDTPLPDDTVINVPDPGMAPLLAARLAAEVLVTPNLGATERVVLIRSLVPLAAANPTALDTVLARLAAGGTAQ